MSRNGRPLELPGLYWDKERNRYFPISSKPQERPAKRKVEESDGSKPTVTKINKNQRKERHSPTGAAFVRNIHSGVNNARLRPQLIHEIAGKRFMESSYLDIPSNFMACTSKIKVFDVVAYDGLQHIFAGDVGGTIYKGRRGIGAPNIAVLDSYSRLTPISTLVHEVDHLLISEGRFMAYRSALATGESVNAVVGDIHLSSPRMIHWPKTLFGDMYSAHFEGRSLALGLSRKVALLADLNAADGVRFLRTKSDVLSVHRPRSNTNIILAGCRSGAVQMFDVRIQEQSGRDILVSRFQNKGLSSVIHLNTVKEWQILVSTMAGDLEMFDLRFTDRGSPIACFSGHVNSHTANLGIAIDPSEEYLFAAGQDSRIRAWSLASGCQLFKDQSDNDHATSTSHISGPVCLNRLIFEEPPRVLKITEESSGLRLWANEGPFIRNFNLGYHGCNDEVLL